MFNLIGKRFWFFIISAVIILIGVIFLGSSQLKFGIEFSSGSLLTLEFDQPVSQTDLREELGNLGYGDTIVQETAAGDFLLRTQTLNSEMKTSLEEALTVRFGPLQEKEFNNISPMVATETAHNAAIAVAVAAVGILLYVTWAFRKMPKPFHYGICAIIALIHDAVIAMGIFAILGFALGWEVDLMFITGILAVIGYSINNTVVIFDKIRENLKSGISSDFETVVNNSVVETLGRCLNTSITTFIVILALFLFVGSSIKGFVVVMMVGIIAGTFSSSCISPALLVVWHNGEWGRFIGRRSQQISVSRG